MNKIIPTDHDESTHGSTTFNLQNLESMINEIDERFKNCFKNILYTCSRLTFLTIILAGQNISTTAGGSTSSMTHMSTNGICSFSPTSIKGKWIFLLQTIILSFTPIMILLIQNGTAFYDLMQEKDAITHKNELVSMRIENYTLSSLLSSYSNNNLPISFINLIL